MFVKVVQLPPFRAVSFHVAQSETPEGDAWAQLEAWARPRGILDNPTVYQVYGRNNPTPMQPGLLRGYEFMVAIPDDDVLDPGMAEMTFPGGLYAVVRSKGIPTMIENYEKIFGWIAASPAYVPDYPGGYDFDHMPGLELEQSLSAPGEDAESMLMDVYVPIRPREQHA